MPIPTEQERLETLIAGRYRLEAILGRGGTGVVFEGVHTWTGRRVAVKLLKPEYARDLGLVRRFLQEARAAAGIEHPHVIEVLDMGAEPDGTVYLVLELLKGETLGRVLERRGQLPVGETLRTLLPVMDALAFAHRRDILHRDLKPDNIFLRRDPTGQLVPTLLDFGMARMVQEAWGHATQSGTLVGTPFYMSPEQAEGEREVGPPTDVWSMGVILYRCLTGRLPFEASTPTALLLAIVQSDPKPVAELAPDVPEPIASAVDRAIRRDLGARWPRIEGLAGALRDAAAEAGVDVPAGLGDEQAEARADAAGETVAREPREPTGTPARSRHAMAWAAGAALLLAVGAVAAIGWWADGPDATAGGRDPEAANETVAAPDSDGDADGAQDEGAATSADAQERRAAEEARLAATHADSSQSSDRDEGRAPGAPEPSEEPSARSAGGSDAPRAGRDRETGASHTDTRGSTPEAAAGDDAADAQERDEEPGSLPGITSEW